MNQCFKPNAMLVAIAATFSACATPAAVAAPAQGRYVAGDFHNHTTCSDGAISVQKLVDKATGTAEGSFGLDWFVQAGHGGSGNRNCTLVEDESLATPAYPFIAGTGPNTSWANSIGADNIKGTNGSTSGNMWRWQSVQEYQYPVIEYLNRLKNIPLFMGLETVVPGHEHTSMSVISGQIPAGLDNEPLPTTPGPITERYTATGNANALAQFEYCFDRNDGDLSRATIPATGAGNNWTCAFPGGLNSSSADWNAAAQKLVPAAGPGVGNRGHIKTLEAIRWMQAYHPGKSYYVPAHLERAGPFNPDGNNGFNIEHLRDFNNAAPQVAFGFETQPGHGASNNRGEYQVLRNNFGAAGLVDSVGGTTYGGTGVYGAQVGGVWDALLGEGRNWWFFASSDWHNRGIFAPDDRRPTQDFYPGEYQRNYTFAIPQRQGLLKPAAQKLTPQQIVDGLRTGNNYAVSGQLIDRLSVIVCASIPKAANDQRPYQAEQIAQRSAFDNTTYDSLQCATMGEKLKVRRGADVVVGIAVRDPEGANHSPYVFDNPSLAQIGISQPLNKPQLDHIDVIGGLVSGYRQPGTPGYSGEWPRNASWLKADGTTTGLGSVPDAAKNSTAAILASFGSSGPNAWTRVVEPSTGTVFYRMGLRIPAVFTSQYVRLRGSNLPASVPYETDSRGNPLSDVYTNAGDPTRLAIPCSVLGSNVPDNAVVYTGTGIDGCPNHLAVAQPPSLIAGQKAVSYDVAAWADLWFYSNPVYIEVEGSTKVAGVK